MHSIVHNNNRSVTSQKAPPTQEEKKIKKKREHTLPDEINAESGKRLNRGSLSRSDQSLETTHALCTDTVTHTYTHPPPKVTSTKQLPLICDLLRTERNLPSNARQPRRGFAVASTHKPGSLTGMSQLTSAICHS